VVQLRTNFGGGKTHAMLALYHLFSGEDPARLPGIPEILDSAGVTKLPSVRRAVLVGNRISPGSASVKPDGTEVRTLWGELAWQLGGREGWELIAEDDRNATNPGARLQELFERYGPCLVLVDEWVAYARQLHDEPGLPGGTFDTQFTFAQTLTETAKTSSKPVLVAISLPQSESAERRAHGRDGGGRRRAGARRRCAGSRTSSAGSSGRGGRRPRRRRSRSCAVGCSNPSAPRESRRASW
jgi:predicted AAA+ superfamily ATPase